MHPDDANPDSDEDDDQDKTFLYEGPLFLHNEKPGPQHSRKLIAKGGADVQKHVLVTGQEKFEHMVLYCLTLLHKAEGRICAFYTIDFDCDDFTLKVVQQLIAKAGYITRDFLEHPAKVYRGFWAWKKR